MSSGSYIWTFGATEDGVIDLFAKEAQSDNTFCDSVAMSAACAIINHPIRKDAEKKAKQLLKDNDIKEPFHFLIQGEILRAVFYSMIEQ